MDDEPEKPVPRRRGWRRFFQFRMGSILLLMLVIAFSTGWVDWKRRHYQDQRDAIREIAEMGGSVTTEPLGPAWWHAVLGDDHIRVTHVSLTGEEVTDGDLRLLACMTDLQELTLDNARVNGRGLKYLSCPASLQLLSLVGADIGDEDLAHLSGFNRLECLLLDGTRVSGKWLEDIATAPLGRLSLHSTPLNHLDLKAFRDTLSSLELGECDGGLVEVGDLPQLVYLGLEGSRFHELYLHDLPNLNLASLTVKAKTLRLERLPSLTELVGEDLASVHLEDLPALTSFRTCGSRSELLRLSGVPQLTAVQLVDYPMPSLINDLAELRDLKNLAWDYRQIWSQSSMRLPFGYWAELESLSLNGPWVDDETLVEIVAAGKLTNVDLSHTEIGHPTLARLTALHHVASLNLGDVKAVDDDALARLAVHRNLKELTLRGTSITDAGLRHLADLPALEELDLSQTLVTDAGLMHLKRLPLKYLKLNQTEIRGEGLQHLTGMTSLTTLELNHTYCSDVGMKLLGQIVSLENLHLAETMITAAGLQHLHGMANLQYVDVDGTALTQEEARAIANLPRIIGVKQFGCVRHYRRTLSCP